MPNSFAQSPCAPTLQKLKCGRSLRSCRQSTHLDTFLTRLAQTLLLIRCSGNCTGDETWLSFKWWGALLDYKHTESSRSSSKTWGRRCGISRPLIIGRKFSNFRALQYPLCQRPLDRPHLCHHRCHFVCVLSSIFELCFFISQCRHLFPIVFNLFSF